ncbi:sulfotransferase family protein [Acaryochloris marina]|uniref:sulfotransferase family protein n=1 Tax=Acaryochloris marina TaxID=155978 RepID=UPI0021C2F148|nr:sulfotransferase family protein [Acaryochloris marina]BDM80325.1 hypothetical protein AM10699_31930 [Acaryochloris marina MBIC10699]
MILSTNKKFIFAHNPKAGGTSIRNALSNQIRPLEQSILYKAMRRIGKLANKYPFCDLYNRTHTTLYQASLILPNSIFSEYFKFGIVRDPYEWAGSFYRHYLSYYHHVPGKINVIKKSNVSFSEFATKLNDLDSLPYQSYTFINPYGEFIGNSIGFLGDINRYLSYLGSIINIDFNLQHHNKNYMNNDCFLSASDKKLIDELWRYDFDFFGDFCLDCNGQIILPKKKPQLVPLKNFDIYDCWRLFRDY